MILDDIKAYREKQLEKEMSAVSFADMKKRAEKINSPCRGFGKALAGKDRISVIAEVKKASPSKGLIQPDFDPPKIASEYEKAGAAAVSCLTEEHYFMGSSAYLSEVHQTVKLPVLRKDFIISSYQIYEAKVIGADAVLLIAAMLDNNILKEFYNIAESLDLDVLGEAHDERETYAVLEAGCRIAGINNRNLKTFEVSLENSEKLSKLIPDDRIFVSESGISTNDDMKYLRSLGADAVLIGETLMRSGNISESMKLLTAGV